MIKVGDVISLDNDKWYDLGKKYHVIGVSYRPNSTAVDLVLEDDDDNIIHRTEASNQIIVENVE
jgi:hypothetical protein